MARSRRSVAAIELQALEDVAGDFPDDLRIIDHKAVFHGALAAKANRSLAAAVRRSVAGNGADLTPTD
jgi:hypothetical protein